MRAKRFLKNIGRNLNLTENDSVAFDKTKVECYNCHKRGHFAKECRAPWGQDNKSRDVTRNTVPVETPNSSALVSCDGLGGYDWSDQTEKGPTNYALMTYSTPSASSSDSEVSDCSKSYLKAVENHKSTNKKLLTDLRKSEIIVVAYKEGLKYVEKRLGFFKTNESIYIEQINVLKINIHCRDRALTELQRKLDLAETEKEGIQLNVNKLENASKSLFPLRKSDLSSTGLEELFNKPKTEKSKDKSNEVEPESVRKYSNAPIIKDWVSDDDEKEIEQKEVKPSINRINFVKATTDNHPKETVKTGNMSLFIDYKEIDGGYVAFGGNPKGGKITSKGKIKTGKLDFKNMYFVRELKFNLFIMSQICDKKNIVLFTDTECIVLSPDFKLIDENQILLRVPRQKNMYNIDLKNIVPTGGLTCLFEKATKDDSKLWHRRLGHLNFKTINKFMKGNLVRGFPSKIFKNSQSCVACQKGKQYRASSRTMLADLKMPTTFWAKAVNTACYVQNRVLVTKPHNKTPYELFHGRTPTISFLRPFGCLVTILNTIDHLGKFDGKAEEGFFVGYSLNIVAQSNDFSGTKASNDVGKEKEPDRDYILLPLWTADSPLSTTSKSSQDNEFQPLNDGAKKVDEDLSKENECNGQREEDNTNNTNRVNTVTSNINAASSSGVNVVGTNISIGLPPDPNMPLLEDIGIFEDSHDDELVFGTKADFYNLDSIFQTRRISKNLEEHGLVGTVIRRTDNKDLQNCSFACFLSQLEPKKVLQALKDPSWIEAIQEELLQFKLQDAEKATLFNLSYINLPQGKRVIGSKWVFRNKMDERGIVIRNKARLVAQGHIQEEGIDYDEVFAPVARIEAMRLFLAYASFKDFIVYQMDVKSAFLHGKIEEEVYVCQPSRFKDPGFPDKVYTVEKALYGLHQAPRVWYETMSTYLLDNRFKRGQIDKTLFIKRNKGNIILVQVYVDDIIFGSTKKEMCDAFEILMHEKLQMSSMDVKKASTPMETSKPLLKDEDGEKVDVHMYRSMIGSLMYLTSSRPDIMFTYALTVRPTIYTSCIKQFWTIINDDVRLQALINGKKVVINEASIRHDLKLNDAEGTSCLSSAVIFEELAQIGYENPYEKLTFYNAFFSPQ
nr:hypothetical protein [Tanacetum cinerariifolium]